jgi:phospholipase/lecithinase/hemolysin
MLFSVDLQEVMRLRALLLGSILMALPASAGAAPFSALYVFGDSLSDTGNLSALAGGLLPAPPYASGRASNGPVAVEYLAASLGLPLFPAALGGGNFAVIGAATGPVALPTPLDPTNTADNVGEALGLPLPAPTGMLNAQIPAFLTLAPLLPVSAIADALFFLWGGPNDLAINFARGLDADPNGPLDAAARIGTAIDLLYGAGARHFLVPNMPDIGLTPGGAGNPFATGATVLFNQAVDAQLASRRLLWADAQVISFDTFGLFQTIGANPSLYGFGTIDQPCYVGPLLGGMPESLCADDDAFLFWDGSHPTTRAHALLGAGFASAVRQDVPEPATLLLTLAGVMAVLRRRRRG